MKKKSYGALLCLMDKPALSQRSLMMMSLDKRGGSSQGDSEKSFWAWESTQGLKLGAGSWDSIELHRSGQLEEMSQRGICNVTSWVTENLLEVPDESGDSSHQCLEWWIQNWVKLRQRIQDELQKWRDVYTRKKHLSIKWIILWIHLEFEITVQEIV